MLYNISEKSVNIKIKNKICGFYIKRDIFQMCKKNENRTIYNIQVMD